METNKIYNENCLQTMAKMPDCFVDCVVTSPPYDNLRSYDTGIGNEWNFETFKPIAKELFRITKEGGVVVWVVNDKTENGSETGTSFRQALYFMECGFRLHDTMIWHKPNPMPTQKTRYEQCFEFMFVFSKSSPSKSNIITEDSIYAGRLNKKHRSTKDGEIKSAGTYSVLQKKNKTNVWSFAVGKGGTSNDSLKHPAPFPEKLAQDHILSWTNENDVVYDPFGGSGTTAKMAHLNNRKWILSEISSNYCEIARKRLEPYLNQKNLFF